MGDQLILCQSEKWLKTELFRTLSFCSECIFRRRMRIEKKKSENLKDSRNRKTVFNMGVYGRKVMKKLIIARDVSSEPLIQF